MPKTYIGDSVYADFDGYHIILTTENGYGPSNTICLEPGLLEDIVAYHKRARELDARATALAKKLGEDLKEVA